METLENCGPLSDPMLCTALSGSGSISPNLLITSHNGHFGATTTLAAFNHPQFHHHHPSHLDDSRYGDDLSCVNHNLLMNSQHCNGLLVDQTQPNIGNDAYTSNNYVNIHIKYEYDDGMHKSTLSPCLSPQLAPTVDESVQQIQYQFECANNPHLQSSANDSHVNYIDQQQQQQQTQMHEATNQNGYAVFQPDDSQLLQPKLEHIYEHSLGYECYMPPTTNEVMSDHQEPSSSNQKYSPTSTGSAQLINNDQNDLEELNTRELAQRISSELKRYSIPQAIFAQKILCRSQGTLSDLLRNPKPWSKLKSGRETFRRMSNWLKQPEFQRMTALRLAVVTACKRKEEQSNGSTTQSKHSMDSDSSGTPPSKKSRPSSERPNDLHENYNMKLIDNSELIPQL